METVRCVGLDLGAERVKVAEVLVHDDGLVPGRTFQADHGKDPAGTVARILADLDWAGVAAAAVTGRLASTLALHRVPTKAAVADGFALLYPGRPDATVVSIGSHGFFVAEFRGGAVVHLQENSRCSQGTGNFLRQLVERFDLSLAEADRLCEDVADPAPLSGRCPVILKTDMTHLANRGEGRERILAGLYDAVCENVQALVRPAEASRDLLLVGGVARSLRIRRNFADLAARRGMRFLDDGRPEAPFLEAFGAAVHASRAGVTVPLQRLFAHREERAFETFPGLAEALPQVIRMTAPPVDAGIARDVIVGFDIGSTGSKAVALDVATREAAWQSWRRTLGDPVAAARGLVADFLAQTGGKHRVRGVGVTGSGREIVGSLLSACFGPERVRVLNEIAAHGEGALHHDPEVDTIFEIGGQDAKYIRLDHGRICDAAMNEACSAGTGSFIEEQGGKFEGVADVGALGRLAIAAPHGVSLGQHCSVFMAEQIDQAVSAGQSRDAILAGLYDAVVQNYVKRVKGTRSVGQRIFCQGMPFLSDALAAAVARHTGRTVVVPPSPGMTGALGIALVALRENVAAKEDALALDRFLGARVESRDTFVCGSTKGCGGAGNHCRIDRLSVALDGERKRFTWGGNCSLYDRGTGTRKLPDGAPDPFAEREAEIRAILDGLPGERGRPVVALTDEFSLKGLIPFFATFVDRLGLTARVHREADHGALKRGIEHANVPWCAPMQLFHGTVRDMLDADPDVLLLPALLELPREGDAPNSVTCPIVQAAPGVAREAFFRDARRTRLVAPTIRMGAGGLDADDFRESCRAMARDLQAEDRWETAFGAAREAQRQFDARRLEIGRAALAYAEEHGVVPVVVLGRAYTLYNDVLNSNVPGLLRRHGALAIPVDCYPMDEGVPTFGDIYWTYSQANLRAAHQVRRTDGVYSVFCSNYSCGPDSFTLGFYAYVMENKPFAIIETDGHSGDAGTNTRIEAFLHCVHADRRTDPEERLRRPATRFKAIELEKQDLAETRRRGDRLLINPMGAAAPVTAAMLRSEGILAEVLPLPDRDALERGRRCTSGKECVPMTITLGSVLQRLERERDTEDTFALLMPTAGGPCRFGVYNLLHKIAFEKTGWKDRVRIVSPADTDYFAGLPADFQLRLWFGMVAADMLLAGLHDVRPVETVPGAANEVHARRYAELIALLEQPRKGSLPRTLHEAARGMYGVRDVIRGAAREFARLKDPARRVPTVAVVGEIYVRLDPFANDFVIERLERAGVRARLAPFNEWIEYTSWTRKYRMRHDRLEPGETPVEIHLTSALQVAVLERLHADMGGPLGWGRRTRVPDALKEGVRYVTEDLLGEAILTLGSPIHEFLCGEIDGVVSVGPLECMPNKIAESHFLQARRDLGLPSLTLALNGDPQDDRAIEDFAFEVREHAARRPVVRPGPGRRLAGMTHDARTALVHGLLALVPPLPR